MENGEPDLGRPSWMPPDDVLAVIVPAGQFLIRAERIIVALSHLSVYPNGCMLDVYASARSGDVALGAFEHIVFTAQFGGGITAATDDKDPLSWRLQGQDGLALNLMHYGQEGNSTVLGAGNRRAACTFRLWLYPLPRRSQERCPSSRSTLVPARPAARWMGGSLSPRPRRRSRTGADPPPHGSPAGARLCVLAVSVPD